MEESGDLLGWEAGWSLDPTLSLFEYLGPDFLWSK